MLVTGCTVPLINRIQPICWRRHPMWHWQHWFCKHGTNVSRTNGLCVHSLWCHWLQERNCGTLSSIHFGVICCNSRKVYNIIEPQVVLPDYFQTLFTSDQPIYKYFWKNIQGSMQGFAWSQCMQKMRQLIDIKVVWLATESLVRFLGQLETSGIMMMVLHIFYKLTFMTMRIRQLFMLASIMVLMLWKISITHNYFGISLRHYCNVPIHICFHFCLSMSTSNVNRFNQTTCA